MRRWFVLVLALGAVALPASNSASKQPSSIPRHVQIKDPAGDANYGAAAGARESLEAPPEADILRVWFSHDSSTISVNVQTAAPAPGPKTLTYRVWADPFDDLPVWGRANSWKGCLYFWATVPGGVDRGSSGPLAGYSNGCHSGEVGVWPALARVHRQQLADGTGVVTITVRRDVVPHTEGIGQFAKPIAEIHESKLGKIGSEWITPHVQYVMLDETARGSGYRVKNEPRNRLPRCEQFRPVVPRSYARNRRDVLDARVIKVTDKATARHPVVVRYRHPLSMSFAHDTALEAFINNDDSKFFAVQVVSRRPWVGLNAQIEWSSESDTSDDFLIWLFDGNGRMLYYQGERGSGADYWYQYAPGYGARPCQGFIVESDPWMTRGRAMKLKLWLGRIGTYRD